MLYAQNGQNWSIVKVLFSTTSLTTRQKLLSNWDVLPHPPYSPDLVPTDYHLFLSFQNFLNGLTFADKRAVKTHLEKKFFADKSQTFYVCRIMESVEEWQKVIDNNCQYIID